MPNIKKFLILNCSLLSILFWSFFASAEGQRKALLIGINDYARSAIPDLRGAVNDVNRLADVLQTKMNFPEGNIIKLTDKQATRENILNTLSAFISKVNKDDIVYIHFSGHGSQATDLNGDEEDGYDETFLPHDARQKGIADITDEEFKGLFSKLPTDNALIVFDSCHSGTVTRSVEFSNRSVAPDDGSDGRDIAKLYKKTKSEIRSRAVVSVDSLGHVLMTSAPADKEALDGPIGDNREFYGIFSFALVKALEEHGPSGTPEQVHQSVKKTLAGMEKRYGFKAPEPQLEIHSDKLNRALF